MSKVREANLVKINMASAILLQCVTTVAGLIVPRLILSTFGSEVNGLVSSITQFLNYISLVEGGIGSVILAALYKPIADKDNEALNGVLNAARRFFKKIASIFVVYTLIVGIGYNLIVKSGFSWGYVFSLTLILASSLLIQYFLSITYRLLLQADQKIYITNFVQIIISIFNVMFLIVAIKVYPSIHLVKLLSVVCFIFQPVVFGKYVNKHYKIDRTIEPQKETLSQRWDGFGQNLAFFIHSNTDVVLLSLLADLKTVSVYSVYNMVLKSLKSLILSLSNVFSAMIGKSLAEENCEKTKYALELYEFAIFSICTVLFGSCLYLLPSFAVLYTGGVNDVNYYVPIFSAVLTLAEFVYCVRDPYISVAYSAGKFKETAISAYIEAGLNIVISVILIQKLGLLGIAIGTLAGMAYRMVYQVIYLKNYVINRGIVLFLKRLVLCGIEIAVSLIIISMFDTTGSETVAYWVKNGAICVVVYTSVILFISLIFDRRVLGELWRKVMK